MGESSRHARTRSANQHTWEPVANRSLICNSVPVLFQNIIHSPAGKQSSIQSKSGFLVLAGLAGWPSGLLSISRDEMEVATDLFEIKKCSVGT